MGLGFDLSRARAKMRQFKIAGPRVGTWDGTIEKGGAEKPLAMQLTDDGGVWRGRLEIDSPIRSNRLLDRTVENQASGASMRVHARRLS